MGLIGDLFPSIDVPRKRSSDFEKLIRKSAIELNLEAEDGYVLKVIESKLGGEQNDMRIFIFK